MSGSDVDVDTRLPKHRVTRTVGCKIGWNCILVLGWIPLEILKKEPESYNSFCSIDNW